MRLCVNPRASSSSASSPRSPAKPPREAASTRRRPGPPSPTPPPRTPSLLAVDLRNYMGALHSPCSATRRPPPRRKLPASSCRSPTWNSQPRAAAVQEGAIPPLLELARGTGFAREPRTELYIRHACFPFAGARKNGGS